MVTNIAHRGARLLAPENTFEAAQIAHESGAEMWELDVQYSSDNKLIVIHDETLERTTDIHLHPEYNSRHPWHVCHFSSHELKKLNFGYAFNKSSLTNAPRQYDAPFLDNAIQLSKNLGIEMNIEIKDISGLPGHKTIAKHVYNTVHSNDYLPHVLFSSFHTDYLFQIRKMDPTARIAVLVDHYDNAIFQLLASINAQAYHPHWSIINQSTIDQLHQKKIQVNVWTVNNKNDMLKFIQMGVDGIITDDPARLSSIITT